MEAIQLQLGEATVRRLRELAHARGCTPESLIQDLLDRIPEAGSPEDALLGWCADEPQLMDTVLDFAMRSREEHPVRQPPV